MKNETVYTAWGTPTAGPTCLTTDPDPTGFSLREKGLIEQEEIPLFSIRGSCWEDVMQNFYAINGWGDYIEVES